MSATGPRETALLWVSHIRTRNIPGLMSLAAPEATWWISGLERHVPGAGLLPYAEREATFTVFLTQTQELEFEVRSVTAEDDRVMLELGVSATRKDGKKYENDVLIKMVISEGRIMKMQEWVDFEKAWEFMGSEIIKGPEETM